MSAVVWIAGVIGYALMAGVTARIVQVPPLGPRCPHFLGCDHCNARARSIVLSWLWPFTLPALTLRSVYRIGAGTTRFQRHTGGSE